MTFRTHIHYGLLLINYSISSWLFILLPFLASGTCAPTESTSSLWHTEENPPLSGVEAMESESQPCRSNGLAGRPCNGDPNAWFISSWTWNQYIKQILKYLQFTEPMYLGQVCETVTVCQTACCTTLLVQPKPAWLSTTAHHVTTNSRMTDRQLSL